MMLLLFLESKQKVTANTQYLGAYDYDTVTKKPKTFVALKAMSVITPGETQSVGETS